MKPWLTLSLLTWASLLGAVPSPTENPPKAASSTPPALNSLDLQRESLKKQRDSLRQQQGITEAASTSDFEFVVPSIPAAQMDCPALEPDAIDSLISNASKKQSLEPQLLRAIMRQESAFKPCAVSVKGAQGLMQLMPATAAQLHVTDPFDPEQNVEGGAAFLKQLLKRYNGDLRLALVAYNAGATRADQLNASQYPRETQGYLANIFAELGNPDSDAPKPDSDAPKGDTKAPADPTPQD